MHVAVGRVRPRERPVEREAQVAGQIAVVRPLAADADAAGHLHAAAQPRGGVEVEAVVDVLDVDAGGLVGRDQVVRRRRTVDVVQTAERCRRCWATADRQGIGML